MEEEAVRRTEGQGRKECRRKNQQAQGSCLGARAELASQHGVTDELSSDDRAREDGEVRSQVMMSQQCGVPIEERDNEERREEAADGGCGKPTRKRAVDSVQNRC